MKEKLLNILITNGIKIDYNLIRNIEDDYAFFAFLILRLNKGDFEVFITHVLMIGIDKSFIIRFLEIILNRLGNKEILIKYCLMNFNKEDLVKYSKILSKYLTVSDYNNLYISSIESVAEFEKYLEKYKYLHKLYLTIMKKEISWSTVRRNLIIPLLRNNVEEYLSDRLPRVFEGNDFDITFWKSAVRGTYLFQINEFVLKFRNFLYTPEIVMCDRFNEFILRENFSVAGNKGIFLDMTPMGKETGFTIEDVILLLEEISTVDLVIEDSLLCTNFAIVDYEIPENSYRSVNGIIETRNILERKLTKNLKLIDHDFVYDKHKDEIA